MRGKKIEASKDFIIMNSRSEYFCGMMYGGQLVWTHDYNEAKPLNDERKFKLIESISYGEELMLFYI